MNLKKRAANISKLAIFQVKLLMVSVVERSFLFTRNRYYLQFSSPSGRGLLKKAQVAAG
jgi:hypothetical protein